jgi:hypothetical protein
MTDTFDYAAAAGKEDEQQDAPVFTPDIPTPDQKPVATSFDFEAAAGRGTIAPPPVDAPFQEITDPLGRPLANQPPPPQWSFQGTPLPGTKAAEQGLEIHPLSRAVLQNFDLTDDISGNSAALKRIVKGVYGPNYDANRASPIPVDDLTDAQLQRIADTPKLKRALQLDSITRRRMAEDAEEAAVLRGEIPLMLAGEGSVDTMVRMMRAPWMRTPEAIAAQGAGVFEGILNIGTLGALESVYGARLKGAAGAAARAQAARTTPLDTFTSTFMQTAFPGGITANTYIPLVWTPLDIVSGFTHAVGNVARIYAAGGFNEETANLLKQESFEEGRAVIKLLQEAAAKWPSGRIGSRFMQKVQDAESDFAIFRLAAEDPAGAAAAVAEVFARNVPVLAASAAATYLGGPRAGMTVSTLGQFAMETYRPDQQRLAFLKKKTGIDISTPLGMQLFLQDPDAQRIYNAYGRARGAGVAGVQLLTLGYLRGGSFFNHRYLTGQLSERVIFNAISEGAGEGLASLWATGKVGVRDVVIEVAMGVGQGVPNTTVEAYVSGASDLRRLRDASNAEKWLSGVTDLKGAVAGIPVAKLDTAASVMGEKLESQGIDTVYITASELARFDQDGEAATTLGLNPEDVARLAAEGGTVEVSAATFVRHILGKDGFDALIEHTMFEPTGMTPSEAREYSEAGIGDQIQQQIEERARNNLAPGLDEVSLAKLTTDITTIQDQVAGQLEATGRYDANKSRLFGLLTAQRYATRAIRLTEETGQPVDAAALFASDNMQIQGGQPAAQSAAAALTQEGGFEAYRNIVDPAGRTIPAEDRPNLRMGDMYGMLPKDAEVVGELDDVILHRGANGDYYATAYNADLGEQDVVGFIQGRENGTELAVVEEMQGKGIGSELQYLFRRENPLAPTGGLTEAGASRLESTYDRLAAEYMDPLEQSAKEFGVSKEVLRAELDAAGGDITQTQRFKDWFKESAAVDENGVPTRMYHGTKYDIEAFEPDRNPFAPAGVYLSDSPFAANTYAGRSDFAEQSPNVLPTYVSVQTPIVIEVAGEHWSQIAGDSIVRIPARLGYAEQEVRISDLDYLTNLKDGVVTTNDIARWAIGQDGIDGVIFKDIIDRGPSLIDEESAKLASEPATNILVFKAAQIKSVFNRGAFDPASDNILEQSAVDIFDTPLPVTPTGGKKGTTVLVKDIAAAFNDDHQTKFGRQLSPEESAEDYALVKEMAVDEIRMALTMENSGLGWYAKDVQDAVRLTSLLYPTLLTEKGHREYFLFMAGIFSNGTNPVQAWEMAAGAYELFLADPDSAVPVERRNADGSPVAMTSFKDNQTGEKITKPAGWGVRGATNNQQLAVLKYLVQQEGSLESGVAWFLQEHPRDEINRVMLESGGFKAGRYKTKADRDGPPARGTDVLGPKLGNYTASLLGIEVSDTDTTIDKWYTRSYRRWTGRLFEAPLSNEGVADMPSPARGGIERNTIFRLTGEMSQEFNIGPEDVQAVLWFFEKRLWANHGASLDEGTNSNGAKSLLEKRGIDVPEGSLEQGASLEGTPTSALKQQRGATAARGGFTPSDLITDQDGNPVNLIQIFEKADPTTFLHESGHFWLEQLKADALAVGGGLQQDFTTVTDWWASRPLELREEAVKRAKKDKDKASVAALQQMTEAQVSAYARSGTLRGEGPSRYLSVAMHEQFARGVENYFATGRAPSLSLAGVFSAFKVWVGSVYAKLAGAKLDVQFSAEVTAVIDRMLAADEEIALIEGQYNLAAMYTTAEQAGMTPTQFASYQKKIAEARDDRRARQLAKHVKELKRERTAWWKEERETLRDETEQEVAAEPAYRLLYALTTQGLADGSTLPEGEALDRMDRGLLKELLEAEGFSLDDLPRIDSKAVYEAAGLSPGVVAQAFGYEDVDTMILDLVGRQPYAQAVDAAIDVKMEEEHGSIESSGETEALASAYSDKTAQVLAAELAALRTTEPAFKQAFVRAYARDRLLEMPSAQIRPYRFLAAEKRHANMAGDALRRGDRVAAYQHQFQRLVNHYMATEALKAQLDIEKKTRYLKAFTKRGKKFPTIEADYVDNILRILAAVNFGQGAAGQQSRFNEIVALQEFIEEKQAADGSLLDVPAWLTDTTGSVANSTREISYLQFLQLHETIKRYEQQGRAANKILRGDEELSLAEGKASLLSVLDGMNKSRVQRLRGKTASARGVPYAIASVLALADAQLLKVEALLENIDGQIMGPWHQTIYEPFNQAAVDKYRLQEEVSQVIGELIANLPKDVRRGFGKRVDVGDLGTPGMAFTRGELIMMALNVGNESNLDKFIRGMGGDPETNVKGAGWNINEELIDAALDNLTEEEWSLVRGVWEHAEKLYPTVEGIYRREHGISPDRLEPRTVKTKFGEFKGGYFPMMYDRSIAGVAVDLQQKTALQLMQGETGRASINSSMTKARTGYAAPVDLDISRLSMGLDNTIHFITHYGAVRNANKILGDRDIRAELETKVGIAYTEQLTKWVSALASNGNDSPPVDIVQQGIRVLYNNTTVGILGFSYSTLAMQTLGLFNGQDRLLADSGYGPAGIAVLQKDMAAGVAAAFLPSHIDFVIQASGEMQGRRKSMDREVSQVLRNLAGKDGVVTGAQRFSMQAIAEVQFYTVDIPVWTAAYNRALRGIASGVGVGDTDAAIKYADRVVRMSQSAGGLKDLAAIQRHKGLMKGLTMFYSFFSALYFVLRSVGVEFTQNAKEKPVAATARAATRLFVLLALQSVATGFIRGDMPDWDEEDEDKKSMLEYIAKESVSTALGTIPVVREIASAWANGYGYSGGAGTVAFDAATKALGGMEKFVNDLGEEEILKKDGDYEDLARRASPFVLLAGAVRGIPAVQLNRILDGLGALYDEADNWHWSDILRGYKAERAKGRED